MNEDQPLKHVVRLRRHSGESRYVVAQGTELEALAQAAADCVDPEVYAIIVVGKVERELGDAWLPAAARAIGSS